MSSIVAIDYKEVRYLTMNWYPHDVYLDVILVKVVERVKDVIANCSTASGEVVIGRVKLKRSVSMRKTPPDFLLEVKPSVKQKVQVENLAVSKSKRSEGVVSGLFSGFMSHRIVDKFCIQGGFGGCKVHNILRVKREGILECKGNLEKVFIA
ncbi:hypothetical protein PGB90_005132 [Kerria lacca]